jgi:hypothetical protein
VSEHPRRVVVLRLSLQGSVLMVVVALLLWGILTFGSKAVATERHSLSALIGPAPSIAGSAAPQASRRKGAPTGEVSECVEDHRCPAKEWPHTTTTRQPGGGGGERAR